MFSRKFLVAPVSFTKKHPFVPESTPVLLPVLKLDNIVRMYANKRALLDATPLIRKIHLLGKYAVTVEPMMQILCPLKFIML